MPPAPPLVFPVWLGQARLHAIDSGAYRGAQGDRVAVEGFVAAVPRRSNGEVRVRVDTADGRLLLTAPEPVPDLPVGGGVTARGIVREPADFESAYLGRLGIARVIEARAIRTTGRRRGGLAGLTDGLRERAEAALERGTPDGESALLRGFVLGQDDRIPAATVDEFQRSGLAHLLAVSGQNVLLLAILAAAVLGVAGVPLRPRLACILGLIAVYVPVAGAGASIQRAGIMGAAGVVAALSGRPASRWYALLLAAAGTLALNPRATGDVGWQLSFAAVIGIALWSAPLRDLFAGTAPGRARMALAEGLAVTVAATVATAPLMAHHFERLSIASLPANLAALPAVAPAMWLGMLAGAVGQAAWVPVEPLTALAGVFAGYVEQVARWCAAPGWAQLELPQVGTTVTVGVYGLLLGGAGIAGRWIARQRGLRPAATVAVSVAMLSALGAAAVAGPPEAPPAPPPDSGFRVTVLDVGQGDSILLDPDPGDPILVDAGPAGGGVAEGLRESAVDGLAAAVITHDESDHSGGLGEVLAATPTRTVAYAQPSRALLGLAHAASARPAQLAEGSELRSGQLRLAVLWPPRVLVDGAGAGADPPDDPNLRSLVLLARWHRFRMLLTGDAEAEAVPLDPGPVDVLKVAHHGSDDEGLERLLDTTAPGLAVISVGAGNPFGHPTPQTMDSLSARGIATWRTDLQGAAVIDVKGATWSVHGLE